MHRRRCRALLKSQNAFMMYDSFKHSYVLRDLETLNNAVTYGKSTSELNKSLITILLILKDAKLVLKY